ncbi:hypothetical protein J6590_066811 [Homalodisca vitripennis]|nr:hypothetical protein J6590_066811 [Homalodisca vitripennis]
MAKYKGLPSFAGHVDMNELKAFLGLLILSGVFKSGHENASSLFASDGTGDNWFSSVELVEELRAIGLTYVGTMRRNKREIPPEFLPDKNRPVSSAVADIEMVETEPKKKESAKRKRYELCPRKNYKKIKL